MNDELLTAAKASGVGTATRHLFLCATPTKPKCCDPVAGAESWEFLKRRLAELGLEAAHVILPARHFTCPFIVVPLSSRPGHTGRLRCVVPARRAVSAFYTVLVHLASFCLSLYK
jgi:hypothetical protein